MQSAVAHISSMMAEQLCGMDGKLFDARMQEPLAERRAVEKATVGDSVSPSP